MKPQIGHDRDSPHRQEKNMENKNALTKEQQAFLEENFRKIREKELFQKLAEYGPEVDEKTFMDALRAYSSTLEDRVFSHEVSEEELAETGGGNLESCGDLVSYYNNNCIQLDNRHIYEGGFPNCAQSVENGSWCGWNDACYSEAVVYKDMISCSKAWQ